MALPLSPPHQNSFEPSSFRLSSSLNSTSTISNRLKGRVLLSLFKKSKNVQNKQMKKIVYRWYVRALNKKLQDAIDCILTKGAINKGRVLYMMKAMAKRNKIQFEKQKQNENSAKKVQKQDQISSESACAENTILKQSNQNNNNASFCAEDILSSHQPQQEQQQNNFSSESISFINIKSGHVIADHENSHVKVKDQKRDKIKSVKGMKLQLGSCGSIFNGTQQMEIQNKTKIKKGVQIMFYTLQKKHLNFKNYSFRNIIEYSTEQDYVQQLKIVKRSLQLAETNFIAQYELQQMLKNCDEQSYHLQNIDRRLQNLKQKFTISKTASIIRILRKITYPLLSQFFQVYEQNYERKARVFQIQDIKSSTSLSRIGQSFKFFKEGAEDDSICCSIRAINIKTKNFIIQQ